MCCASFRIDVDAETRKKWASLDNPSGDGKLSLNILEPQGDDNRYLLKFNHHQCDLLTDDGLCQVQKQYGHEYLPATCRDYPRNDLKNNLVMVETATLSCPVISRQLLFNNNDLDFNYKLDKLFKLNKPVLADQSTVLRYHLTNFVSSVLNVKKVRINIKLFYIAHCVGVLNEYLGTHGYNESMAHQLFSRPKDAMFEINRDLKSKKIAIDPVTAGSYWKKIGELFLSREVNLRCVNLESSELIQLCARDDENFDHYREIYELVSRYRKQWQEQRPDYFESLLERYIITSFVNKGFPLHPLGDQFSATLVFIMTAASAIQLALWIAYSEPQELYKLSKPDDETLQQIFYHLESKIGHTDRIYQTLTVDSHMAQINRYAQVFLDLFV